MEQELMDYAFPTMKAEEALKRLHYAFIDGDLKVAGEMALEAVRQASLAYVAVKYVECQKAVNS